MSWSRVLNPNYSVIDALRELRYERSTGEFFWKRSPGAARIGDLAGHLMRGYRCITLFGKRVPAHRLVWFVEHGVWPKSPIDHINGSRSDNRITNLRLTSPSMNRQNLKKAQRTNKVGILGVSYKPRVGRFEARITVNQKTKFIGLYATAQEAGKAYLEEKRRIHPANTL